MELKGVATTSMRDFLHVVFKRKVKVEIFFCAVVGIGTLFTLVTLVTNPTYEASSQILVKIGREDLYVPTGGNINPVISLNRREQINSEIEILRSQPLTEKVIQSIGPTTIYKSLDRVDHIQSSDATYSPEGVNTLWLRYAAAAGFA